MLPFILASSIAAELYKAYVRSRVRTTASAPGPKMDLSE